MTSKSAKGKISKEERIPSLLTNAEVLKKCLDDNNGDYTKCKSKIEAFKSATSSPPTVKLPTPSRILTRTSLTDV